MGELSTECYAIAAWSGARKAGATAGLCCFVLLDLCVCVGRHRFDDHLVEFSKLTQDRIVGTNNETAHVSSLAASVSVSVLFCFLLDNVAQE